MIKSLSRYLRRYPATLEKKTSFYFRGLFVILTIAAFLNIFLDLSLFNRPDITSGQKDQIVISILFTGTIFILVWLFILVIARSFYWVLVQPLIEIKDHLVSTETSNLNNDFNLENRDELGDIADLLNSTFVNLREVLANVSVNSKMSEVVVQLSSTSLLQASRATAQELSIQQSQVSITELATTASLIYNNSQEALEAAKDTTTKSTQLVRAFHTTQEASAKVLNTMQTAITLVKEQTSQIYNLASNLDQLAEQSKQAGETNRLIEELASQTHLLALNAALEAAGAGIYGERFNVIAQEVNQLSQRSRLAAQKVKSMLAQNGTLIDTAYSAAQNTTEFATQVVKINNEAITVLQDLDKIIIEANAETGKILESAQRSAQFAIEINTAIHQHEVSTKQVAQSLDFLLVGARENTEVSQELGKAVVTLQNLSNQLTGSLARFKINLNNQKVKPTRSYKLAYVYPLKAAFWDGLKRALLQYSNKSGVEIIALGPDSEASEVSEIFLLQEAMRLEVDGILISTVDSQLITPTIKEINQRGVPVLALDSDIENGKLVSLVQTNNITAAQVGARYLNNLIAGQGLVLFLAGYPGSQTGQERRQGVYDILKRSSGIELIVEDSYWKIEEGIALTKKTLASHPELKAIFAANGDLAIGAVEALVKSGMAGKIPIVNIDASPATLECLKKGEITALIAQNVERMAQIGLDLLTLHLNGEKVPNYVDSGCALVTEENVAQYILKDE